MAVGQRELASGFAIPEPAPRDPWAWAGSVAAFLQLPAEALLLALEAHHMALFGERASGSQVEAWLDEVAVLAAGLQEVVDADPPAADWPIVFEYELPFEGGRRPDAVVLAGGAIVVLEFKSSAFVEVAGRDQVGAYARDLGDYHEASQGRTIIPVLVETATPSRNQIRGDVLISGRRDLGAILRQCAASGGIELEAWLDAPYRPLPALVSAARRIFAGEAVPHVKRALAARLPETVDLAQSLIAETEQTGGRRLIVITGVPGAGKTLVGLRVVYEHPADSPAATFLSGNGPLVAVLQDALGSGVFVRDLHKFITSYGRTTRVPDQHVIVFDEAQRAWDADYMAEKKHVLASEPQLLVGIAESIRDWAVVLALVGEGQEIHSGEESGLTQWREAIETTDESAWDVVCPPALESTFRGLDVRTEPLLQLALSMRSRRAERLHEWVASVLNGRLDDARPVAAAIAEEEFPIYVTRDLEAAKLYASERYDGEPDARYGLLASSQAKVLSKFGVDNSFMATSKTFNVSKWFNGQREDPRSCCALTRVATEFGCQGLELDLPIVCWGDDLLWDGAAWRLKPIRRRYPQRDPQELLRNTYRVLLTRGRDGLVIWIPPDVLLDKTAVALEAAGAVKLAI
jgi:DUF2075 family protein